MDYIIIGFVIGLLFRNSLEIVDSIFEFVLQLVECVKAPISKYIIKQSKEISALQNELQVQSEYQATSAIGFHDGEEYIEYTDEEEDDFWEEDRKAKLAKYELEKVNKKKDLFTLNI